MRKRKVKAWAILNTLDEVVEASPQYLKIKDLLNWTAKNCNGKVIPCEITYSLPPNKKRGGK